MSRLGKTPIHLPKGVEVKVTGDTVNVKGPKGTLSCSLLPAVKLVFEGEHLLITKHEQMELSNKDHGFYRAQLNNMIIGVTKGFEKKLSLIGVGYRAAIQGTMLDLQLGYSHPTKLAIPKSLQVAVDKSVLIIITGIDKQVVGQFAATVRSQRPPEPYKGKGIRYENEYVRKKAGKAAKGKTA